MSLVRRDRVEAFRQQVAHVYHEALGVEPAIFATDAADGAGVLLDPRGLAARLLE